MSPSHGSFRLPAAIAGTVLALAPLGDGGRGPLAQVVAQTLLSAGVLALVLEDPAAPHRHRRGLALLALFALFAYLRAPYRYAALLVLLDIGAAAALFLLTSASPDGRSWIGRGLVAGAVTTASVGLAERLAGLEPHGLFSNPHHSAALATAGGLYALARATGRSGDPRTRAAALAAGVGSGAYVVILASRGGALAFASGLLLLLGLRRRFRTALAVPCVLALLVLLPTPLGKRVRAGAGSDPFVYTRLRIWAVSAHMAEDHLLQGGVGLGSFEKAARGYNFPVETEIARYGRLINLAHDEYLELLAEAGLPGLLLVLLPSGAALLRARRLLRDRTRPEAEVAVAALPPLAALLVHALVEAVFHAPANLYAFAALLGLVAAASRASPSRPEPDRESAGPRRLSRTGRALAVLAFAAVWFGGVISPYAGDRCFQEFLRTGDPRSLELAIRVVPGNSGYRSVKAGLFHAAFLERPTLELLDAARHELEVAAALDPLEARHRGTLAAIEHRVALDVWPAGELAERALAHYAEAIRLDPFQPFLRLDRLSLLGAIGRAREAAEEAVQLLAIEPRYIDAWRALARARRDQGDVAGAAAADLEAGRVERETAARTPATTYERELLGGVGERGGR